MPFTIVRLTQFYSLIDSILRQSSRGPLQLLPKGWRCQPIAPEEAADVLVGLAGGEAAGCVPDMGGPAVRTLDDMAPPWLAATGQRKRIVRVPMPGGLSGAFRSGHNLVPGNAAGRMTWEAWLQARYADHSTV